MDFASAVAKLGGSPIGEANAGTSSQVQMPTQPSSQSFTPTTSNFADTAAKLGGTSNTTSQPQDNTNFLQKVGNFFTGSTQAFGNDIGQGLAAGANTNDYINELKTHTDITNNLIKTITAMKKAGRDTSRLEMALIDQQNSAPDIKNFQGDAFNKTPEQIIGDAAGTGLEALSGGIVEGAASPTATAAGRIAKTAAIGSGYGAVSGAIGGMQDNGSISDVAKSAAIGAGVGAATGGVGAGIGELLTKATDSLPPRLIKQVLPQLKNADTVDYALNNIKLGTVDSMVQSSQKALNSYNSQIDAILQHPDFELGSVNGGDVIDDVVKQFPNSEYTPESVFAKMKSQMPAEAKIFTTLENGGDLTLPEANTLRQKIDRITYKTAIDSPEVKAGKDVAAAFGNTLRGFVQDTATETQPIFENYSKEINVQKALQKLAAKGDKAAFVNMRDLMSGSVGSMIGGAPGAMTGVVTEKIANSPVVKIGAAKVINSLAPAAKVASTIGRIGGVIAAKQSK